MRLRLPFSVVLTMATATGCAAQPAADLFVDNQHIRVGVNLKWGGAITHVSRPGGPNIINSFDLGRQIQQSYYSGPPNYQKEGKRKSPTWATFPWNPIQTGDAFGHGSKVLESRVRGSELYVRTIPMLWPMDNDPGECVMETWITLQPDAPRFRYRARLTNNRSDPTQYPGANQETPAVYVNGPWHRLMTYIGDRPFTDGPLTEIRNDHREPWPWVNYLPTEGWAALVDEANSGIGVCVDRPMEFHGGFSGKRGAGGEKSASTGYMSPVTTEILDHNIVYEYSCTFVVGALDEIRAAAKREAARALPSWRFDRARQGWRYENGRDAGFPPGAQGLSPIPVDPSRPVRLIGPYTFWQAAEVTRVRIQITASHAGSLTLYWRGMPPGAASTKPSEWAAWRRGWWTAERSVTAPVPAGARRWLNIDLQGFPAYDGPITGLAMDLPQGVSVHAIEVVGKSR